MTLIQRHTTPYHRDGILGYLGHILVVCINTEFTVGPCLTRPTIYGRDDCINEFAGKILSGTTGLAVRSLATHLSAIRFGDHSYWVPCAGLSSLEAFLNTFVQCLGRQSPLPIQFARRCLGRRFVLDTWQQTVVDTLAYVTVPQLVVLDGFEGIWDNYDLQDRAEGILRAIRDIPQLTLLITMRGTTVPCVVDWVSQLGSLSPDAARSIFLSFNKGSATNVDNLLQKVSFNPTLVGVLACIGNEHDMRPEELLDEWERDGIVLLEKFPNEMREFRSSVEASLKNTMEKTPDKWKLLRILSMFPRGLPLTELLCIAPEINNIAATDLPMLDPDDHLLKLYSPIRSYLFQFHPPDDESIHDVYSYVFKQARMRVCQPGEAKFTENVQYLTTFGSNIESVLLHALDRGCESAIEASLDYSALLCSTKPHLPIMRNAVSLARRLQSKRPLARCLQSLGDMGRVVGRMESGNPYQEAIELFTELGDMASAAHCERNLGLWTIRCGFEGLHNIRRAAEMFRDLGDQRGEAQCFLAMAEVSKDPSDVRHYLNEATIIFMELGDQLQIAQCKQQEAHILLSQRQVQDGLALLCEAAEIFTLLGDEHATAECLQHIGVIFHRLGDHKHCYNILNRALDIYQRLGRDLDSAFCMKFLATRYWSTHRFAEAIALQEKAVPIFWGAAFIFGGAETRLELGMSQIAAGRIDDAIVSLDIARRENLSASFLNDAARCELQRIAQNRLRLIPYLDGPALTLIGKM
ncbi:hypothetical protein F5887DRAFT_997360 [Amanita rubescens]|nr:hypothetical protein F5887DRAFT_997360 [Amanita rubescens]